MKEREIVTEIQCGTHPYDGYQARRLSDTTGTAEIAHMQRIGRSRGHHRLRKDHLHDHHHGQDEEDVAKGVEREVESAAMHAHCR